MSRRLHFQGNARPLWRGLAVGLAFLYLLKPDAAQALDPSRTIFQYNCRTWSKQNGLPADGVNAIVQTADGYLWLGTAAGLVSFDGIEFKSLDLGQWQSKVVTSLSASSEGGLWLGMEKGAFGYCDGQNITFQGADERGGVNLDVHAILEAGDHTLWVGAEVGGARLSQERLFQMVISNDLTALMQDSKGRVWMGTAHRGLYYWEKGMLNAFPDHALDIQEIRALAEDKLGQIWVGTDNGPFRYDSNFVRQDFPFPWYPTRALLVDREGMLWLGTVGAGLVKYQNGPTPALRKQDGLADDTVHALAEDQEGNIWVGTLGGLSQLSDLRIPTFRKTEGAPDTAITDVCPAHDGGLWVATLQGFAFYDGVSNSVTTALSLTNEYVSRIFEASNGDIYLINGYKDVEIFRGTNVLARYPNTEWPSAFGEDAEGVVVAVGKDLFRVGTNLMTPFPFAGGKGPELGWIFNITTGQDGSLWLAADAGLCRIKNGAFRIWSAADGLAETHVVSVCEDKDGAIWGGTTKGIFRLKDDKIVFAGRENGLFDNIIHAIVADGKGRLWLDSSRGFFSVDITDFEAFANGKTNRLACTDYTALDGIKSSERFQQKEAGCRTVDGRIWFPTALGLAMIDRDRVQTRAIPPRIYIVNSLADGKKLTPGQTTAPPGRGELEFQYTGLSYVAPQRIHYRYRLEGYNKEWVDAGTRRSAFYTNLKPGRYRFLVEACNEDGVWNSAPASVEIELRPHFYQTGWFIMLVGFAAAGVIFVLYAGRLQHLHRRQEQLRQANDLLELKVRERTGELRSEIEERKRVQGEIENVHRELVDASRRAGQAEVATSVLHNVGNVLNSVNTSASVARDLMRTIPGDGIAKVAGLLESHRDSLGEFLGQENRAASVINYLRTLDQHLTSQQTTVMTELHELSQNIEHIKEIVAMQQSYAKFSGAVEPHCLSALMEDAVRMHAASLERHRVKIVRQYEELPEVNVDKHKVLQILVNLITNAKHALRSGAETNRVLTLDIHRNGNDCARISVADTGMGIDPANLTRIFAHGFTTRRNGHGFGLHGGALAAREMGGALTAQSEGLGRGATFILEIPMKPKEAQS